MKIAKNKLKEKYQEETGGKQIQIKEGKIT